MAQVLQDRRMQNLFNKFRGRLYRSPNMEKTGVIIRSWNLDRVPNRKNEDDGNRADDVAEVSEDRKMQNLVNKFRGRLYRSPNMAKTGVIIRSNLDRVPIRENEDDGNRTAVTSCDCSIMGI